MRRKLLELTLVYWMCVILAAQAQDLSSIICETKTCKLTASFDLQCSNSGCTEIPTGLDDRIVSLRLQMNKISYFPEDRLTYSNLEELDLSENNLTSIPREAFMFLDSLKTLILSRNKFRTLEPSSFFGMRTLRHLYVNDNLLTSLESSLFYPDLHLSLTTLDLSANFIEKVDHNALTDLRELQALHLEHNNLKKLENRHFLGLRSLQELYFDHNLISEIEPGLFRDCSKLHYLDLSYNNLSVLHKDTFKGGLLSLQSINLYSNQIVKLDPELFEPLHRLNQLHLDKNPLEELPNVLPLSLEKLTMRHMPCLQSIGHEAFANHSNLQRVYITENPKLTHIDPSAFGNSNSSVSVLDLSDNALRYLDGDLVNWKKVQYLDLSGNPWNCDCNMAWTVKVFMFDEARERIQCQSPSELRGRSVSQLSPDDFSCQHLITKRNATIALVVLVTLVAVGGVSLVVFRSRKQIRNALRPKVTSGYKALYENVDISTDGKPIYRDNKFGSSETVHFDRYSEERKLLKEQGTVPELV